MTLVLAVGLPAADPQAPLANLAQLTDADDSTTDPVVALDRLAAPSLRAGGTVVAVVPTWAGEPTLRHLQTLRCALDTTRLVIYPTLLPPLSATSFAVLLAECVAVPGVTGSDLVAHLEELEGTVVGAAWLGSVSGLRWPAPTLGQHARSLLPRSRQAAIIDERPRIVRLRRDERIPLPEPDRVGWRAVMAAGDGDVACAEASLSAVTPAGRITRTALSPRSTAWWGTKHLVELALRPHDVRTVADYLVSSRPTEQCRWCGQAVTGPACPFCGMRQPVVDAATTPDRSTIGARP